MAGNSPARIVITDPGRWVQSGVRSENFQGFSPVASGITSAVLRALSRFHCFGRVLEHNFGEHRLQAGDIGIELVFLSD
ncbi:MAG: hypothetical protein JWN25_2898 [Verrucomicrobiales bacterium]|nr:hypothetical protein [Verrucomicrobiales bacterium]